MTWSQPLHSSSFAPAERKEQSEVIVESDMLKDGLKGCSFLDELPDPIIVLNSERQILFANQTLLRALKQRDDSAVLGLRPGEVLDCVRAANDSGGCGTTEFCRSCGAVNAILHTQRFHTNASRDCQVLTVNDDAFNFRVWTSTMVRNGREYTLLVLRDIADEIYRNSLEHIFFHDLINIGSGLYGLMSIIGDDCGAYRENRMLLMGLTEELLEEINSQRDLLAAEKGEMNVALSSVDTLEIMRFVVELLGKHQVASGKKVVIAPASEKIVFLSDPSLLKRIIINITKNALEASAPGGEVVLKSYRAGDNVIVEAHNDGYIDPEVGGQIFNRAFSTKGRGRGLGTYSAKLLGERYLHGKVYFNSSEAGGTSFFIELPLEPKPAART